jgi:hypothetical protein
LALHITDGIIGTRAEGCMNGTEVSEIIHFTNGNPVERKARTAGVISVHGNTMINSGKKKAKRLFKII